MLYTDDREEGLLAPKIIKPLIMSSKTDLSPGCCMRFSINSLDFVTSDELGGKSLVLISL